MTQADEAAREAMRDLLDSILAGHLEKHGMEQKAVEAALAAEQRRLETHRESHREAHLAHERNHELTELGHTKQHDAESRAVLAATNSMDRRLNQMNEFREQLREQASTFLRREQFEAFVATYERGHDEVLLQIATEREERRANEGVKRGMGQTTTIIVAAIGLVGTVLGIVIILSNVLTGT